MSEHTMTTPSISRPARAPASQSKSPATISPRQPALARAGAKTNAKPAAKSKVLVKSKAKTKAKVSLRPKTQTINGRQP